MPERTLPILMYHGLHAGPHARGVFDPVYSVAPQDFMRQLDWLHAHGYRAIRLRDIASARGDCVVISFDDGDVSNIEIALPLLRSRGMPAEFFITADFIGRPGYMSAADVRALAAAGMGVQSHGFSHSYLDALSLFDLDAELRMSKERLQVLSGAPVEALALPGGRGGERERTTALAMGYRHVLNSEPGTNRDWVHGEYLQRLPVTRDLALADFARLVQWRGVLPRARHLRYRALALAKRALGDPRYETLRKRMLPR